MGVIPKSAKDWDKGALQNRQVKGMGTFPVLRATARGIVRQSPSGIKNGSRLSDEGLCCRGGLGLIEGITSPMPRHELIMGTRRNDLPGVQHHNTVGVSDGGQAMGDENDGAAPH